jgi:hypothetical protein
MPSERPPKTATFLAFFLAWAKVQRWTVPALHVRICHWLDTCKDPVRVLMVFRGAAKSTLYAIYKAYCLWRDSQWRSLIWAADDKLATRLTRDTLNVLRRHPWCGGMLQGKPGAQSFWVSGALDARNASMEAVGVGGNATGQRADAIDFDDVEVPKNIRSAEMRENLRAKVEESTHIISPGGQKTWIGTPHTHNSVYSDQIEGGAAVLKIPLFAHAVRFEDTGARTHFRIPFEPEADGLYVLAGIGKHARLLVDGADYRRAAGEITFARAPGVVLDVYTGCAWPERFTRAVIEQRRKETRTLNGWDSQYMLEARPLSEVRLDPDRMIPYDSEPTLTFANRVPILMLGKVRIVGCKARWDCALGKVNGDASALCVVFQGEDGRMYWHRAVGLTGDLEELDERGQLIGGQVKQMIDVLAPLHVPNVVIETNGTAALLVAVVRKHLKPYGIAVSEDVSRASKNTRILEAFEPALLSSLLWAHTSVIETVEDQMRDFNPASKNQPDDYLDSAAGAIAATPVRITRVIGEKSPTHQRQHWAPHSGVHDVSLET